MKKTICIVSVLLIIVVGAVCLLCVKFPVKNHKYVSDVCVKYDLDERLVFAVINVESGWRENAVSPSGAMGVMQVMPSTASEICTKLGKQDFDLFDFEDNVEIGCFYLRYLIDLFGDEKLALCAYNAGLSNVKEWMQSPKYCVNGDLIDIPFKETKDYVKKVDFNKKMYGFLL